MSARFVRGLSIATLLAGCTGELIAPAGPAGGGSTTNDGNVVGENGISPTTFTCNESASGVAVPLRRLSKTHFKNSVHDLVLALLPGADGATVWGEVSDGFDNVPSDSVDAQKPFSGMDQNVSQQHVDAYFRASDAAARALTGSADRVTKLAACAEGAAPGQCIDDFILRVARRAYRHEPNAGELAFLKEVYAADAVDADAMRDVLTVALNAPEFLYHIEGSGEAVAGKSDTYALDDYELASRIAFQFWQTAPDDTLMAMAAEGKLSSDEGFAEALDHALTDPRAAATLETFVREWFDIDHLPDMSLLNNDPLYQAFVDGDMPSPGLRADMIQDVLDSFAYHVERGDGFAAWFTSPYSFAQSPELAALYGVPAWDGSAEPPKFPADQGRAGLITRAALLSTGSANTRPIKKGVFLRERVLCDDIAAPPANVGNQAPALSDDLTTREVAERLTEQKGTSCAGCHLLQINGLGFATEGFDALGRHRTEQRLFTDDGKYVKSKPVDTASTPRVVAGDERTVTGANDLSELMVETGKVQACFARQYARFTFARKDDLKADGCALEAVRQALMDEKTPLKSAMRVLALRPEFRQRFFGESP